MPDAARLRRLYGLSMEDYEALAGECCPLCEKKYSARRLPVVEHDHSTGEIHGVCCSPCNDDMGRRGRDSLWYQRVADWLNDPPAHRILGRRLFTPDAPPPHHRGDRDGADGASPVKETHPE